MVICNHGMMQINITESHAPKAINTRIQDSKPWKIMSLYMDVNKSCNIINLVTLTNKFTPLYPHRWVIRPHKQYNIIQNNSVKTMHQQPKNMCDYERKKWLPSKHLHKSNHLLMHQTRSTTLIKTNN